MNNKRLGSKRILLASLGISCLILLSLSSVSRVHAQQAARDPETSILRFRDIKGWKGTFSYKLDAGFKGSFGEVVFSVSSGELSSETVEKTEVQGEVSFSGGSRGRFVGQGRASYNLQHFSLIKWGDKRILDTADGNGTAEIIPEIETNYLQFDLREGSYTLSITPGSYYEDRDEFGVQAKVVSEMEIVDSFLEDMRKANVEVPFPQMLHAWFPENLNEEGCVDIGVMVFGFPLPAFGQVLSGSFTDHRGGVLAWDLAPIEAEPEEFMVPVEITSESSSSLHFHPPSQEERKGMRGLTYEAEMAERQEAEPSLPQKAVASQVTLFLLDQPADPQADPETGCAKGTVGVDVSLPSSADSTNRSDPRNNLMLKAAAHVLESEGGSLEGVYNQGLLGKAMVALQDFSPVEEDVPRLGNELYERNLVEGVTLDQMTAVIRLGEGFETLETCIRERITAQLEKTASQFSFVNSVKLAFGRAAPAEE